MESNKRLKALNEHFALYSGQAVIKGEYKSSWNIDRSLSKLNIAEAKEVFCSMQSEEEKKLIEFLSKDQRFE